MFCSSRAGCAVKAHAQVKGRLDLLNQRECRKQSRFGIGTSFPSFALWNLFSDGGADGEFLIREMREIRGSIPLPADCHGGHPARILWDKDVTQVANT
jgi:hypothetical protein